MALLNGWLSLHDHCTKCIFVNRFMFLSVTNNRLVLFSYTVTQDHKVNCSNLFLHEIKTVKKLFENVQYICIVL